MPKKQVLIVEDEEDIRYTLKVDLEHQGEFECLESPNRGKALQLLKDGLLPSVILADIMLDTDHEGGLTLISDLKAHPQWKDIPVIVLSARSQSVVILDALRRGAVDYLVKPYDVHELHHRIQRAYDLGKTIASGIEPSTLEDSAEDKTQKLRNLHVDIMKVALLYWELSLQKTKSELAAESEIWSYQIDEKGTLRSKTLDRYLNEKTLPQKPRTHLVIQTAQYVLDHCAADERLRPELESQLESLRSFLLESSL